MVGRMRILSGGLLAVLWLLVVPGSLAQTGKLAGRVVDEAGEGLVGATVFIQGTQLGAATDVSGDYAIIRVPPGTYSVRYSIIGFQTKIVEDVLVTSNNTATINITLNEEVFEGEEVIVTAERPLVDVSLTSSMQTLSKDDIAVLPVQELNDIVNLQAGVVDGHFRGGRIGEVQYQVNGVSVNDPYNNESTLQLDRSVLQEVQVISGTFDAEYGQALSGVVNAVLRTGDDDEYAFTFESYIGEYVSPGNDSTFVQGFFNGRSLAGNAPLFPEIDRIDPLTIQNYQASLSGPVPIVPNTTFLVNGQRFQDQGYLLGRRLFLPTDSVDINGNFYFPTGDGAYVPLEDETRWSFLGKLTNRSIPNVQLSYQAVGGFKRFKGEAGRGGAEPNYAYRYNPDGIKEKEEFSLVHGIDFSHTLSNNVFYELALRQNYFDFKDYRFESLGSLPVGGTLIPLPGDSPYAGPRAPISEDLFIYQLPDGELIIDRGVVLRGVNTGRFARTTDTYVVKGAVTAQAGKVHLLKAGGEMQFSDLTFGVPGGRLETVDGRLAIQRDTLTAVTSNYNPRQGALFAQDRIEWGDLRVRAGLRLEYFDANATIPSDLANPANSIEGAPASPPKATTAKLALAPRLGVSFPILERSSLFFSYGHFYQMPALGTIFSNADYSVLEDLQAAAVEYGVLGNPDLEPEFTAQYEFGFKSEITEFLGLDVSLFYKDIRDLLGVQFIQTYTAAQYARFTNVDYGGVRGFTIALDQRGLGPVNVSLDYTYQSAVGNASDPRETANRAQAFGGDPEQVALPRQVPFNWDQRHTLNVIGVLAKPGNFSLTSIIRFASGQPYTPIISGSTTAQLEDNSGRKDSFVLVDLRAEKYFTLGGMQLTAFARVFNLFDEHFANGFVFADTGSPFYSPTNELSTFFPNPGRLNPPRRIEAGISFRGAISTR